MTTVWDNVKKVERRGRVVESGQGREVDKGHITMSFDATTEHFWKAKYQYVGNDGSPIDLDITDTWRRVSRALAVPENDPKYWADRFYQAMEGFRFIPAGRILAGAGTDRDVTLNNCFVMGQFHDSMFGIFEALKEASLTLRQGGGVGMAFSDIRPAGSVVHGIGSRARGPLAFMDVYDAMARSMTDSHDRTAAQMAVLRCDHPDIEAFVGAKQQKGRFTQFNLSVAITDDFMDVVTSGGDWPLVFNGEVYRTVTARELWDSIMRSTYNAAEPGTIFIDRVNRTNPLYYCEVISATNPCGEQPLPPYGACLLGSLNLPAFVIDPFSPSACLNFDLLSRVVTDAVRMLDNTISVSNYPLDQQRTEAYSKRRIGMGITGLADALIMCGIRYGSPEAVATAELWMSLVEHDAYMASTALAEEKSPFPLFDSYNHLNGDYVCRLPDDVRNAIAKRGLRNGLLTSVAPTGTISLLAGNISSGLEPVFRPEYTRRVLNADGSHREEPMVDYAVKVWRSLGNVGLPPAMVSSHELTWREHVDMMAAVQRHVDSSISKTINLPKSISFEDFKDVYRYAYDVGCKSVTTYRPNDITGEVLVSEDKLEVPPAAAFPLRQRPDELPGTTYRRRWQGSSMYITISDEHMPDGRIVPYEIFVRAKGVDNDHWTRALTRVLSAVMRRDADFSFLVDELLQIYSPRGGDFVGGKYVASEVALIGQVLRDHFLRVGYIQPEEGIEPAAEVKGAAVGYGELGSECPHCHAPAVIMVEGCQKCISCSWSRC